MLFRSINLPKHHNIESRNMDKKTITGWALQVTWSDGKDETLLDIDDETASAVDTFLTELEQERHDANKK